MHVAFRILLAVVGVILLLPGICAGLFVPMFWYDIDAGLAALWAVCFAVSAGGVWLLVIAFRKRA